MRSILILFVSILIYNSAYCQYMLTEKEQAEDLKFIYEKLSTVHPKLANYKDSIAFYNLYDSLTKSLNAIHTEHEAVLIYSTLVNSLGCGHTGINVPFNFDFFSNHNMLPIKLKMINGKAYVIFSKDTTNIPLGAQVLKINEKTIEEWLQYLSFINMGIDNNRPLVREQAIMDELMDYKSFLYTNSQYVNIKYMYKGKTDIAEVPFLSRSEVKKAMNNFDEDRLDNLYYFIDTSLHTVYINSKTFADIADFEEPAKDMVEQLKTDTIHNVIIDLRGNPGGAIASASHLLKYFGGANTYLIDSVMLRKTAKPLLYNNLVFKMVYKKKEDKKNKNATWTYVKKDEETNNPHCYIMKNDNIFKNAKLFVLIDESSFSLAPIVAAYFKSIGATLIGTEAGGRGYLNYASIMRNFKLPHSRYSFNLPFFKLIMPLPTNYDATKNLMPNIEVKYTMDDIFNNRDPFISKVKELIKESKNSKQ
jgi:hypothetical protein